MAKLTQEEKDLRKKLKLEKEEKERLENNRKCDIEETLKEIENLNIQKLPKHKIFEVGESVIIDYGNFVSAEILGIIDERGVYDVKIISNPTKPYSKEHHIVEQTRILGWFDIFKKDDTVFELPKLKTHLRIQYMQQNIQSLIWKVVNKYGVDFEPWYQRGLEWDDEQKELLLTSIFNNNDIGKFTFIYNNYDKKYGFQVLDGKQRLTTIVDFYLEKFKYKGYYYSQLSDEYKYRFNNTSVSVGEVNESNVTEKDIVEYFININDTGRPVSKEHLDFVKQKYKELCKE